MPKINKFYFDSKEKRESIRINKFLSDAGLCSRREADEYIEKGDVLIDGIKAELGSVVLPDQKVSFCGKPVTREIKLNLIAFNKPQGIVCTTDRRDPDNIIDFIQYESRIYPIGRLDKDSEGLILLTNDGDIVNKILRAGNNHEKEYIVKVNKIITHEFLKGMSLGVPILDTETKPCFIEAVDNTTFRIILTQGLNRQIRRMCEYFGYNVLELKRIRIMNINLGRLKTGGYRNLTDKELEGLCKLVEEASNEPAIDVSFEYDKKKNAQMLYKKSNVGRRSQKNKNMMEKDAAPLKIKKVVYQEKRKVRKNSEKDAAIKSGIKGRKTSEKDVDFKSGIKGKKNSDRDTDFNNGNKSRKKSDKVVDFKSDSKGRKNFNKSVEFKSSSKNRMNTDKAVDFKSNSKNKINADKVTELKSSGKVRMNTDKAANFKSSGKNRMNTDKIADFKSRDRNRMNIDKAADFKSSGKDKKNIKKDDGFRGNSMNRKNVDKAAGFTGNGKDKKNNGNDKNFAQQNKSIRGNSNGKKTTTYKRTGRNSK